jgi:hypothetical protein
MLRQLRHLRLLCRTKGRSHMLLLEEKDGITPPDDDDLLQLPMRKR